MKGATFTVTPNPSVKGTSCGKPQDVPYVERWPQMRALFLAVFIFANAPAVARESVQVDFRCLTTDGDKPIRLEWKTFSETDTDWTAAYVRYKGSKKVIPLVLRSTESTEMAPDRPFEFKSVWLEVIAGKISGEYAITSQGANIYGFVYKNYRTGKEVEFSQDSEAYAEVSCKWN